MGYGPGTRDGFTRNPRPLHAATVDAVRHDCGDKLGFVLANLALALDDPEIGARVAEAARGYLADKESRLFHAQA